MKIGFLTEEQKYQWNKDGYLVLKGVLSGVHLNSEGCLVILENGSPDPIFIPPQIRKK